MYSGAVRSDRSVLCVALPCAGKCGACGDRDCDVDAGVSGNDIRRASFPGSTVDAVFVCEGESAAFCRDLDGRDRTSWK